MSLSSYFRALLYALPLSSALSPQVLEGRDNVEAYSYTRMGTAQVQNIQTYYTTSTKPCTVTKTALSTTTQYVDAKSIFTTTMTTTTTVKAQKAYTSTIPASKGFIPIDQSIPGASYDPFASKVKRDAIATSPAQPHLARSAMRGRIMDASSHGYPQKVEVVYWKQNTNCQVETVTETKTQMACQNRAAKTVTQMMTATKTQHPSTASPVYGACLANNIATSYKGLPLLGLRAESFTNTSDDATPPGYSATFLTEPTTGYECCVAAIQNSPPAAFWGISQNVRNTNPEEDTVCIILNLDKCNAPQKNPSTAGLTFEIRAGPEGLNDGRVYSAGNGYCGQWFRGCTVFDDGSEDGIQFCNPPKPGSF